MFCHDSCDVRDDLAGLCAHRVPQVGTVIAHGKEVRGRTHAEDFHRVIHHGLREKGVSDVGGRRQRRKGDEKGRMEGGREGRKESGRMGRDGMK